MPDSHNHDGVTVADVECVSCKSEDCVEDGEKYRCLNCGANFEMSPAGKPTRSVKVWWAVRIGYAMVMVGLPLNILWSIQQDSRLAILIGVVALPLILFIDGPKVAEAVHALRGGYSSE